MVDSIQLETAREEGMQRGMQQGMQHVILRMLRKILPDVPVATTVRLEALDSAALDELSAALFSFHSVDDVEGWLAGR